MLGVGCSRAYLPRQHTCDRPGATSTRTKGFYSSPTADERPCLGVCFRTKPRWVGSYVQPQGFLLLSSPLLTASFITVAPKKNPHNPIRRGQNTTISQHHDRSEVRGQSLDPEIMNSQRLTCYWQTARRSSGGCPSLGTISRCANKRSNTTRTAVRLDCVGAVRNV